MDCEAGAGLRILVMAPEVRFAGGMRVQAQLLARCLQAEGHAVELVSTAPGLGPLARVPVVRTLVGSMLFVLVFMRRLMRHEVVLVFAASGNYFRLRVLPAILLAKLFRRRVVASYRGGAAPTFLHRRWWWIRPVLAAADRVIVPSAFLAQVFARRGFPVRIVPSIADVDRFPFVERRGSVRRLLVARHHEPHARLELALHALARLRERHPQLQLTFAGRGTDRGDLAALAAELGLDGVTFLGASAPEEMPRIFASHDLLLSPVGCDNFPNSVLEAQSAGLPVVATRVGGVPDLVAHDRSGLLVPPEDAPALAAAVGELVEDPDRARELARAGRRVAEAHAWPRWQRAWVSVLGGHRPPRPSAEPVSAEAPVPAHAAPPSS